MKQNVKCWWRNVDAILHYRVADQTKMFSLIPTLRPFDLNIVVTWKIMQIRTKNKVSNLFSILTVWYVTSDSTISLKENAFNKIYTSTYLQKAREMDIDYIHKTSYNSLSTGKCCKDDSSNEGDCSRRVEHGWPCVKCLQQVASHIDTNEALKCTGRVDQSYSTHYCQHKYYTGRVDQSYSTHYIEKNCIQCI